MSFVFPILLGGLALIGIPVLIHLIMRQKPKTLLFPAFRFLVKRHRTNLRKLRLRHLLLLALRVLVLAALCLALARPRAMSEGLGLSGDRPVAAVLLFDTSYSMEYAITGGRSRLEEAKKRGLELLDELPAGSRVAILDSAENHSTGKGDWLVSLAQARERVSSLRLRFANAPVTTRLENAYRLFADLARNKEDEAVQKLPRLLFVLSDRTRACWDQSQLNHLLDLSDQVPPPLERLGGLRDENAGRIELLRELRQQLPPPSGQDYPEQALIDLLHQLGERVPALDPGDYPDPELMKLVTAARSRMRALIGMLELRGVMVPAGAADYRDRLTGSLQAGLRRLRGVHEVFIDVGVDGPTDLAIADLELPRDASDKQRQVFAPDEKIVLRAVVQATGKSFSTNVLCQVGSKTYQQAVTVKAGERQVVGFEIEPRALNLQPGPHQLEVRLATSDLLSFDNVRYTTFLIRDPRRVLVLADDERKTEPFKDAFKAVGQFTAEVRLPGRVTDPAELPRYQAVYLLGVARPDANLWALLENYVRRGGGVGVIAGGNELDLDAYNKSPARGLLPGQLRSVAARKDPGAAWDLDVDSVFQHPLMKPFREWRLSRVDFIHYPRGATLYWDVLPYEGATVIVRYADDKHRPALLERQAEGAGGRAGRVLMFTTPLDGRQDPRWNNYLDALTSFYVVLTHLCTSYLAGDAEAVQLNFTSGQTVPVVPLPLAPRFPTYTLRGPSLMDSVPAQEGLNVLRLPKAVVPGQYVLEGLDGKLTAAFSVNTPPEECDLAQVPAAEIEALFGAGAVAPVDRRSSLREALQGHWSQAVEMFPVLMIALLLALALENLLANKFYRREPDEAGA
jgi:hypothetical protein